MKKVSKKVKNKNFILPIIALFTLAFCIVVAMLIVDNEGNAPYFKKFSQFNFIPDKKTVCIDAGHGGKDSGATSKDGKRLEKDDTLRLSLLLRDELKKRGYKVVMTREKDEFVSLSERCEIANRKRASLFVAVHRNSSSGNGKGIEAWIHSMNPSDDRLLAENMMECLKNIGITNDRGIHTGYREGHDKNYFVNRNTKMPSCLIEMGFMTSEEDNKEFDKKIKEYSVALADGIEMTLKEMNGE